MPRILLIDDDDQLGPPLAAYFQRFELALTQALRPSEGLALLAQGGFDAAILDVMLPEMDGFELCRTLRKTSDIPVVMLTARGDVMDRVVGLELGADDYLPKPFEPRELVARIHAVLRRSGAAPQPATSPEGRSLCFRGFRFDRVQRQLLTPAGLLVQLSGAEFRLLDALASQAGQVLSREQLVGLSQAEGGEVSARSVDLTISRLRQKLGQAGDEVDMIRTVRGEGYVLDAEVSLA